MSECGEADQMALVGLELRVVPKNGLDHLMVNIRIAELEISIQPHPEAVLFPEPKQAVRQTPLIGSED